MRVRYTVNGRAAAPVINVLLGHPDGPPAAHPASALLDTGADRTVIPLTAARLLGLQRMEAVRVEVRAARSWRC